MQYTIMGFKQENLLKFSLNLMDIIILRYFIDLVESKKLKVKKIDGKLYYWVRYDEVIREFPAFNIKKCTVQARFFKLRDEGILIHKVVREGGTYSYFGIGQKYAELIEDIDVKSEDSAEVEIETVIQEKEKVNREDIVLKSIDEKLQGIEKNSQGVLEEVDENIDIRFYKDICKNSYSVDVNLRKYEKYLRGNGFKSKTNNPSTKYPLYKKYKKVVFFQKTVFEIRRWRYARKSFGDRRYFRNREGG